MIQYIQNQASIIELADKYEVKTTILYLIINRFTHHTIHEVEMVEIMSYHMRTSDPTLMNTAY